MVSEFVAGKELLNPKLSKLLPAPLPFELILVVLAVICSYSLKLEETYNVKVVGTIQAG